VTFFGGRLYHENAHGRVACLDAASGQELWSVDLLARFRGDNITWGLSECLLVDERAVYATAGGRDALLVALDRLTGEVLWRSPPLFDAPEKESLENAGYASPILVRFAGRRLIIGCSLRHLYCADAETGEIQWTRHRPTSYGVIAMMPVLVGNGVFVTAPFGPPGRLYRLVAPARPGETFGAEEAWSTGLDTAQGGVVHVNGRLFGATYPRRGTWVALEAASGATLFEAPELVKGSAVHADNRLYILSEDGWMQLFDITAGKFEIKGRFQPAPARDRDAWAHPVIHDGRLYLRYHDTLRCYDVRQRAR
ncbi:MAG TPA: PQQ-binding-like beta-propeller repeat protein, partial [Opitutaceae bacterium]|nr:PQQ-binding-like beta-propeller repeat protein [Opitutaceae bacterium]